MLARSAHERTRRATARPTLDAARVMRRDSTGTPQPHPLTMAPGSDLGRWRVSGRCPCPRLKPNLDGRRAWCGGQPEADRTVEGDSGVDGVAMAARIPRILELPAAFAQPPSGTFSAQPPTRGADRASERGAVRAGLTTSRAPFYRTPACAGVRLPAPGRAETA